MYQTGCKFKDLSENLVNVRGGTEMYRRRGVTALGGGSVFEGASSHAQVNEVRAWGVVPLAGQRLLTLRTTSLPLSPGWESRYDCGQRRVTANSYATSSKRELWAAWSL